MLKYLSTLIRKYYGTSPSGPPPESPRRHTFNWENAAKADFESRRFEKRWNRIVKGNEELLKEKTIDYTRLKVMFDV